MLCCVALHCVMLCCNAPSRCAGLRWVSLRCVGLDWVALGWTGLGWIGPFLLYSLKDGACDRVHASEYILAIVLQTNVSE